MSALRVAAITVQPLVLRRPRHARVVRRLRHCLEHVHDRRPMSRLQPSVALDVVSRLRRVVAARRLVRRRTGLTSVPQHTDGAARVSAPLRHNQRPGGSTRRRTNNASTNRNLRCHRRRLRDIRRLGGQGTDGKAACASSCSSAARTSSTARTTQRAQGAVGVSAPRRPHARDEEAYPVLQRDYPLNEKNIDWWASDADTPVHRGQVASTGTAGTTSAGVR